MIEIVSPSRCIGCDQCVHACPANVFDAVAGGIPVIARQNDCQTCFLCEIYCPVDALFVAPNAEAATNPDEQALSDIGLLGSYARALGWQQGKAGGSDADPSQKMRVLFQQRERATVKRE